VSIALVVAGACMFVLGRGSAEPAEPRQPPTRMAGVVVVGAAVWVMYSLTAGVVVPVETPTWTTSGSYGDLKRAVAHSNRVAGYREELVARGDGPDTFQLQDVLLLPLGDSTADTMEIRSERRSIAADQRGFALSVVEFTPGITGNRSFIVPTDSGPLELRAGSSAPAGDVKVSGLPPNSFVQARFIREVDTASFIGEQQARWEVPRGEQRIAFSYVPARYAAWRTVLNPVVGANSIPQWVLGIIGVIGVVVALIAASKIPALAKLIFPKGKDSEKPSGGASPPAHPGGKPGRRAPKGGEPKGETHVGMGRGKRSP
jgi:hypothetical protein